jgi:hypothetical protein
MQDAIQAEQGTEVGRGRRVPGWVAGVGVVVFLLAAGAFIYWFLGGSFGGTTGLIPDPTRAEQGGRRGWRQPANPDGVKSLGNNRGHYVWAGGSIMDIEQPPAGKKKRDVKYQFRYDSKVLLTPEQWHLAVGLRRVGQDAQMAKTLDVTKDQLERLGRFKTVQMELSKGDRDRLVAGWEAYDKAKDKAGAEKALVALLKEVGTKALPATRLKATERVGEISRVLSAEQVRELTTLGAGERVTPIVKGEATVAPPANGAVR